MAAEVVDSTRDDASSRRRLRPFVITALTTPTGSDLVGALTALMSRDDLSAREWVEISAGWKRIVSFAHAGQLAAITGLDQFLRADPNAAAGPGRTDPVRPVADEIAPVLGIAPQAASTLVALTRRVEDRLTAAADALADGSMDLTQLKILERVVRDMPTATARMVEAAAIRRAPRCTARQMEIYLASEAARLDPEHASAAAARGVAERDVTSRRSPLPGCGRLVVDLPLISRDAAWLTVNSAAKNAKGLGIRPDGTVEDRTVAQLRADFVAAILTGQVDQQGAAVPTPQELARLAEVQVVVAYDTLSGESDLPAHLPGSGTIDVELVRDVARRAPLRRLVADPVLGTLLHREDRTLAPEPSDARTPRAATSQWAEDPRDTGRAAAATLATDPRLARLLTDPIGAPYSDEPVPAVQAATRPRPHPRRHLRGPGVLPFRYWDRAQPHDQPRRAGPPRRPRPDYPEQPGRPVRTGPQRQDPRRLDSRTTHHGVLHLDQPHRAHIPSTSPTPGARLVPPPRTTPTSASSAEPSGYR